MTFVVVHLVLGIEHRGSPILGKHSTKVATFPVHNFISCGSKLPVPATIVMLTVDTVKEVER